MRLACPKGANKRLMHCNKRDRYSITSSVVDNSDGGMVIPSAFAAFMLMTNGYLVGICTARTRGLSPPQATVGSSASAGNQRAKPKLQENSSVASPGLVMRQGTSAG